MNERIRQLKHQASLWCDMNIPEKFSEDGYGSAWEDKFAELIVRECMTICDETRKIHERLIKNALEFSDKNIYAAGASTSDRIKYGIVKHFGVKE